MAGGGVVAKKSSARPALAERITSLEAAVTDADSGAVTNARKLEALSSVEGLIPTLPRDEVKGLQSRLEGLCERLLAQNATQPLRRLVVSILSGLHTYGNSNSLGPLVESLLKVAGDQTKKVQTSTKVASLSAVGDLMSMHGRMLEGFSTDIFVVVAKHMKFNEPSERCSAFQCLSKTMRVAGFKSVAIAANIWKMLQKMVPDKSTCVRTAAAQALTALAEVSPECAGLNGEAMADLCKKALASPDDAVGAPMVASECRFAFAVALAQILTSMSDPAALATLAGAKKRPVVTDFASTIAYLDQVAVKGPPNGPAFVGFRAALCLTLVRLMKIQCVGDSTSIGVLMRSLLSLLDMPPVSGRRAVVEEDALPQLTRHVSAAMHHVLLLADSEATILEAIEQVLVPLAGAQFNEATPSTDARMVAVVETLCSACSITGDGFRSVEEKVSKPLLHLMGHHQNPLVQLYGAYCLRAIAHSSPPQLFQLMSVLLNMATVQNAELLGAPGPRGVQKAGANSVDATWPPLLRGLFGHCAALAGLVGELFRSDLGVPHDVTSAVLGTSRALLQPHPNASVSAQRRSCAFILVEGLMCLGTDWVGHRLTTLFALWKAALGKKPVERAKALYQQQFTPGAEGGAGIEGGAASCRDELLSLLCALRSLHAFALHANDSLLTSLPHLHKILVVFLTNISQLLTALPHPMSASFKAKSPVPAEKGWPYITFATKCGIPEILLMIRCTMYSTFNSMLTTQYSSRFVPLLNMLAHDVTIPGSADFPAMEFLAQYLPPEDIVLDLVDPYLETSRESAGTSRLGVAALLATSPVGGNTSVTLVSDDPFSDAAAASLFCGTPRDGPNGTEGLLMPWDAWLDPTRTLVSQCTSPEWDWRRNTISLLSIIMNSGEVSDAPCGQVLMHLLKRRDPAEETQNKKGAPAQSEQAVIPSIVVLMYLREHVKVKSQGTKGPPPTNATEQMLRMSFEGLKEANPATRRLHVEILSLLFYIHYEQSESSVAASIIQHIGSETLSESATVRSSIALLCGVLLRTYAAGSEQPCVGGKKHHAASRKEISSHTLACPCPYLPNVVPLLLKLAKETSQPVRLWMLHAMNLSMQAVGGSFAPFLKDAMRLTTAHLLADLFVSPIVLWVIGALVQSAASAVLAVSSVSDADLREDNVMRILNIWSELQHVRYMEPSIDGCAFATVRAEVLTISTAHAMVHLAPTALNQLKDVFDLISKKLVPKIGEELSFSSSSAVRTAAAQCITDLMVNGHSLGDLAKQPGRFFILLDGARGAEAQAIRQLIQALIRQCGLAQLPIWLQTLKEMILALPGKVTVVVPTTKPQTAKEDEEKDEQDDGAALGGPAAADDGAWCLRSVAKEFAVSCVQLLLEQADPDDVQHFEADAGGSPTARADHLPPAQRLVSYLDTLIALASNASASDDYVLAETGLKLMLLIVHRFRNTRDIAGRVFDDRGEESPLLLRQFEAQLTTCVRHNLLPQANPVAVSLALELLRTIIVERACHAPQRLIILLMQPFVSTTFEPDPLFCESTSTKHFLYRLRCACEILDTKMEEQAEQAVNNHIKDLARWIEFALRDASVLMAGLPLQSIKTYSPSCFSLTDFKAVRSCFREAVPTILRGVCALCSNRLGQTPSTGSQLPASAIHLAFGIITLQLGERNARPSIQDITIFIRTIRSVLLHTTTSGSDLNASYMLDLLGAVWQHIFCVPQRCSMLLTELLDLIHMVSAVIWQERQKQKRQAGPKVTVAWLDELFEESPEGCRAQATISSYAFHYVIAALRSSHVINDASRVQQALDIFVWWLENERSLSPAVALAKSADAEEGNAMVQQPSGQSYWLWLLYLSPFPIELMKIHPAITLKYWRTVCSILSSPFSDASMERTCVVSKEDAQMSKLSLMTDKLCGPLVGILEDVDRTLTDVDERTIVCLFAMLAPAVVAFCTALKQNSNLLKTTQRKFASKQEEAAEKERQIVAEEQRKLASEQEEAAEKERQILAEEQAQVAPEEHSNNASEAVPEPAIISDEAADEEEPKAMSGESPDSAPEDEPEVAVEEEPPASSGESPLLASNDQPEIAVAAAQEEVAASSNESAHFPPTDQHEPAADSEPTASSGESPHASAESQHDAVAQGTPTASSCETPNAPPEGTPEAVATDAAEEEPKASSGESPHAPPEDQHEAAAEEAPTAHSGESPGASPEEPSEAVDAEDAPKASSGESPNAPPEDQHQAAVEGEPKASSGESPDVVVAEDCFEAAEEKGAEPIAETRTPEAADENKSITAEEKEPEADEEPKAVAERLPEAMGEGQVEASSAMFPDFASEKVTDIATKEQIDPAAQKEIEAASDNITVVFEENNIEGASGQDSATVSEKQLEVDVAKEPKSFLDEQLAALTAPRETVQELPDMEADTLEGKEAEKCQGQTGAQGEQEQIVQQVLEGGEGIATEEKQVIQNKDIEDVNKMEEEEDVQAQTPAPPLEQTREREQEQGHVVQQLDREAPNTERTLADDPIVGAMEPDDDDDFGAFESPGLAIASAEESTPSGDVVKKDGSDGEDDDFGAFEFQGAAAASGEGNTPSGAVEKKEVSGGEDNDFGDFEFQGVATASAEESTLSGAVETKSGLDSKDDDFGDFELQAVATASVEGNTASGDVEKKEGLDSADDGFGAFEFQGAATASVEESTPSMVVEKKEGSDGEDDDFGAFEFQGAATASAEESTPSVAVEKKEELDGEDNDFGDFELAATTCPKERTPSDAAAASPEDIAPTGNEEAIASSDSAIMQVDACLCRIRQVFSVALQHRSPKPAQTAVSSMQNLFQNPACAILAPIIVPCLLLSLVDPASAVPESSLEGAWCIISAMAATQQATADASFIGLAIPMMLTAVVSALKSERSASQKNAMAQCLVQLTRADPAAMRTEVSNLAPEPQQAIQQLLREHMSAASAGGQSAQGAGGSQAAAAPKKKIELKMKF